MPCPNDNNYKVDAACSVLLKTLKMKINILFGAALMAMLMACTPQDNKEMADTKEDKNHVVETIMARRSIRKYKAEPVAREVMTQILDCGINAPNGQNKQSWEIRVVDNPELLAEMSKAMGEAHPQIPMAKDCFRGAPVMVFIARDLSYDFSAYDCGLLAQNMMLSAWSMGVGSVCLGNPVRFLTDNDLCKPLVDKLGFSEGYELSLCVGFGYADEAPDAKPRDKQKYRFVD